jgi:uncharacterized protein YbbK (DUF523 family)/uncharacterized protein YbgA (DUF1722 family)
MTQKALVGVSSCLLGEEVRYNGRHKLDSFISGALAKAVELKPVCPEVDIGLGVPREPIQLTRTDTGTRLVGVDSGTDLTAAMKSYAEARAAELDAAGICGYVLKSRSPSCGLRSVPVEGGEDTSGLFASVLSERCPLLPMVEETGLETSDDRELFLQQVLACRRLRNLFDREWTIDDLVNHHARQELLLLAQSPEIHSQLGRLVAEAAGKDPAGTETSYTQLTMEAAGGKAGPGRHVNALSHMLDYLRETAEETDYQALEKKIELLSAGETSLLEVLDDFRRLVKLHAIDYLLEQVYLAPHPAELLSGHSH